MKKILIILVLVTVICFVGLFFKKNETFELVSKTDEVKDGAIYVEECLRGKVFALDENQILHIYIKDAEVYFDIINLDKKERTTRKKISKNELGDLKVSFPYIVSAPEYTKLKGEKYLVNFNGILEGEPVNRIILYDFTKNKYKFLTTPIKKEIKKADGDRYAVFYDKASGKLLKMVVFDKQKTAFVSYKSVPIVENSNLYPLKNGKFLIRGISQKIYGIFDPATGKVSDFAKSKLEDKYSFEEIGNGNLVFITKQGDKQAIEVYDIKENKFKTFYEGKAKIIIEPVIGNVRNGDYIFLTVDEAEYSLNTLTGNMIKLEKTKGDRVTFPLALEDDKIILNKTKGARVVDLKTGKVISKVKLPGWPGSIAYAIDKDKEIIINDMTDITLVFDRKNNRLKKSALLTGKFYHPMPMQIVNTGKYIVVHYCENMSQNEKKYGKIGKLYDLFMISYCAERYNKTCYMFNKNSDYSFVITDVIRNLE